MSARCAKLIAKWLIDHEAVRREDYDLYMYAAHSLIMTLAPLGLALALGALLGHAAAAVTIILPFMVIRKFSGGYHAGRAWICLVCSSLILGGCICVSGYIAYGYGLVGAMLMAAALLIANSPVASENRRLDAQERREYKKVTTCLVAFSVLISLICYGCGQEHVAVNLAVGVILTGALQVPCLWKQKGNVNR